VVEPLQPAHLLPEAHPQGGQPLALVPKGAAVGYLLALVVKLSVAQEQALIRATILPLAVAVAVAVGSRQAVLVQLRTVAALLVLAVKLAAILLLVRQPLVGRPLAGQSLVEGMIVLAQRISQLMEVAQTTVVETQAVPPQVPYNLRKVGRDLFLIGKWAL
jgi:hypothetical protein